LYGPADSVIFDKGHAYFADDSNTMWANGEGEEVKIAKEIFLADYKFDDNANLTNGKS
jgi:hypothetical protein